MNCDQASTHLVDAITGNLPEGVAHEIRDHLDRCPTCRQEELELRALWSDLGRLTLPAPRADAASRFATELSRPVPADGGSGHPPVPAGPSRQRGLHRVRRLAIPAGLAAALLIGVALGRALAGSSDRPGLAGGDSRSQFLLLLHERPATRAIAPDELPRVVAEYAAWAGALRQEGVLVAGEKLTDDPGRWVVPSPDGSHARSGPESAAGAIGGYFVIAADSYDDAVRIARECPHLRYGGEIEVRAIERL
ncbi:MAG TPA: YciI family protein [Gemmatimonadaceae bacterium]|nr:YciI family protein [Gemmatimonadaceae bacterium]